MLQNRGSVRIMHLLGYNVIGILPDIIIYYIMSVLLLTQLTPLILKLGGAHAHPFCHMIQTFVSLATIKTQRSRFQNISMEHFHNHGTFFFNIKSNT